MSITIRREGQRVYFEGNTYPVKDKIRAIGGHFDQGVRAWWVGSAKLAEAERLVAELASTPTAAVSKPGDDTRVKAKVTYKGRTYYVIAETDARCRLTVLDASIDFWASKAECSLIKTYQPREVTHGRYGRYSTHTEYTTLGSIRKFIERQKREEAAGTPKCGECGKRGQLYHDLEDGGAKCYSCCDIPGEPIDDAPATPAPSARRTEPASAAEQAFDQAINEVENVAQEMGCSTAPSPMFDAFGRQINGNQIDAASSPTHPHSDRIPF